jgi:transposase-like protein
MTNPKRYKRYSGEFKREAILRASEEGVTDKAVCDELGIGSRQFRRWRDELDLLGRDAFPSLPPAIAIACGSADSKRP